MQKNPEKFKRQIAASAKKEPADIVIKNGRIINVFTLEIIEEDVAITEGQFIGIGKYEGKRVIDAKGRYVCPGFIDGHVHIESAMVPPPEFAKVVLPHGVTSVIADPHEIANVSGQTGIEYMLQASEGLSLHVFIMLPSCVPATPFETSGATLNAKDLAPFYQHERVIGLGEVMNFPAVNNGEDEMVTKLLDACGYEACIDGHAASVDAQGINVYMTAGIRTDHECVTVEEAQDRLKRGMYVLLREGSAARDLNALIEVVTERNARRCLYVTDDKHLDDLIKEGGIDHNIRMSIEKGIDPLIAIQMATLNAAECFQLKRKGAIAPGYDADFILLDDLEKITISEVYSLGELVAVDGRCVDSSSPPVSLSEKIIDSVRMKAITKNDLTISIGEGQLTNVIEIIPNSLVTKHRTELVTVEHGHFVPSINNDQLKLIVIERHKKTGNIGLGIVKGFGLSSGAIVTTVAHDSHNIIGAGINDEDLLAAIQIIKEMKGGLAVVKNGSVLASLPLPIAGLMSEKDYATVAKELAAVNNALTEIGFQAEFNPFLTLSFLALPVIPELKLTDKGLFNVKTFSHIPITCYNNKDKSD
ncbi:adenine deaminase [Bacillus sp. JJ1562]|uniref:adenine deaminase n=1 Tax=Bacillus sp. JJ1562 TaxID=3122960 RepID=UPI003001AB88